MSLINDALKKAQKQRGHDSSVTPPPNFLPPAGRTGNQPPPGKHSFVMIVGGVALVIVSIAATVFIMRSTNGKTTEQVPPVATTHPETKTSVSETPAPQAAARLSSNPLPASTLPSSAATSSPSATAPASVNFPTATVAANTPATPMAATEPQLTATPAAPPTPAVAPPLALPLTTRIQIFIDQLRISGVRMTDGGNKVILNDRLFRTNDYVEIGLGIRLVKIEPGLLTFADAAGNTYPKQF